MATVGAVNATALLMIAPAPVLWLLVAGGRAARSRGGGPRADRAPASAGSRSACRCGGSRWSSIQGRHGADVLAYSESLESVSYTSTSPEVWRGLGYWLTYVRDAYAATTTAGRDYMVSGRLIATGFVLLLVGLAGLVADPLGAPARSPSRSSSTGVVLGVGVHPIDDPSPLMDLLLGDGTSGAALALRSSTRAVPMLVLGLALGAGALVDALGPAAARRSRVSWRPLAAAAVGAARRRQPAGAHRAPPRRPGASTATRTRRRRGPTPPPRSTPPTPGGRVLQLPGQEFGAFRWGYTVDPPLPGLTDTPARHPRPAAARQRRGDGPAVRPRRPLPVRHRRAGGDRAGRPPARRRHACG